MNDPDNFDEENVKYDDLALDIIKPEISPFEELKTLVESLQDLSVLDKMNYVNEIQVLFKKMQEKDSVK